MVSVFLLTLLQITPMHEPTEYHHSTERPNRHYAVTVISCVVFIVICAIVVVCRKYAP